MCNTLSMSLCSHNIIVHCHCHVFVDATSDIEGLSYEQSYLPRQIKNQQ